jgi:DNA-binding beta-propeller fold protein YncE
LYVANDVPPSVMTIKAGKSRILTSANELKRPESIAVAKDGTVYLTDDSRRLLLRIRQGPAPEIILGPEKLKEPKGLAFDPAGALYVADFGASAILVLRDNKIETFAVPGHRPEEIAFDRSGNLYFTEESPARVMKISPSGALSTFVDGSSGVVAIEDIAIKGDDIYVADSRRGAIFKFGLNGQGRVVLAFEKRTGVEIEAIALDDDGVIYLGLRKPERKFLGMRRVDFIMCISDPSRAKAACSTTP